MVFREAIGIDDEEARWPLLLPLGGLKPTRTGVSKSATAAVEGEMTKPRETWWAIGLGGVAGVVEGGASHDCHWLLPNIFHWPPFVVVVVAAEETTIDDVLLLPADGSLKSSAPTFTRLPLKSRSDSALRRNDHAQKKQE